MNAEYYNWTCDECAEFKESESVDDAPECPVCENCMRILNYCYECGASNCEHMKEPDDGN